MSVGDGSEAIANDEIVYRRVSQNSGWCNPESDRPVAWEACKPNKNDKDGISVWREKYMKAHEAASVLAQPPARLYYVLVLRARALRDAGIQVEPTPQYGGPGHASLANLNSYAYSEDKNGVRELAMLIASTLVESIEGPFGPFPSES